MWYRMDEIFHDIKLPSISIIIPVRNEAKYIISCLESVIDFKYPSELVEIIIIDGMSEDKTVDLIDVFMRKYSNITLLFNSKKYVPHSLNIGILASNKEYIVRLDAHCKYPDDYLYKLIHWSKKLNADNVGGVVLTMPSNDSSIGKAIAFGCSHPFGVGNSYFRIGIDKVIEVDTVPFGCYKREIFTELGLFDEELIKNQDDEYNARLIKNNKKIFLIPDVKIEYYARDSFKKLWFMFYKYGFYKPLVNRKIGTCVTKRQLIPPLFVAFIIVFTLISFFSKFIFLLFGISLTVYFLLNFIISLRILGNKEEQIVNSLLYFLPLTFFMIHFSYGIGYLVGIVRFFHKNKGENV